MIPDCLLPRCFFINLQVTHLDIFIVVYSYSYSALLQTNRGTRVRDPVCLSKPQSARRQTLPTARAGVRLLGAPTHRRRRCMHPHWVQLQRNRMYVDHPPFSCSNQFTHIQMHRGFRRDDSTTCDRRMFVDCCRGQRNCYSPIPDRSPASIQGMSIYR